MINFGVGISHYNRLENLDGILSAVRDSVPASTRIVVADDGSDGDISSIVKANHAILLQGPNKGVGYNKNRLLWALSDVQFIVLMEDDLMPIRKDWLNIYVKAAHLSEIHHFVRVQDKEIPESVPEFGEFMEKNGCTPIYGSSPRGDLCFYTNAVISTVGGFNPKFKGVGYAHGEHTERIIRAGLVSHPNKYVDIKEARDSFTQVGDTTGGRWNRPKDEIKSEIRSNKRIRRELEKSNYIYHPLVLE